MGAKTIEDILRTVVGMDAIAKEFQPLSYIGVSGVFSTGSNNKIKIMLNGHMMQSAVRAGSFDTVKPTLELSHQTDRFKFYLYSDYYKTDGPSRMIPSDAATVLYGPNYSAAPGRTTENSEYYTVQPHISYGDLYFTGFFQQLKTECAVGVSLALTDGDDMQHDIGYGELGYKIPLSNKGAVRIKAYKDFCHYDSFNEVFSEETAVFFSKKFPSNPFPEDEGVNFKLNSGLQVTGAEISTDFQVHPNVHLLAGASCEFIDQYGVKLISNANVSGRPLTFDGIEYQPFEYYGVYAGCV